MDGSVGIMTLAVGPSKLRRFKWTLKKGKSFAFGKSRPCDDMGYDLSF